MNTRETRARASLKSRTLTAEEKAAGYVGALTGSVPYNSDSKVMHRRDRPRGFVERMSPDVFKRSLAEDKDIMVLAGHNEDPESALARIGENLTVSSDASGLTWEALLPDTRSAADLVQLVDKRIIRGASFEFEVIGSTGQSWEKRDDSTDLRTIKEARLYAFNPVIWPAYEDAALTVEYRHATGAERENRGTYFRADGTGIVDYYDPTITPDTKFAAAALDRESYAMRDALEYLRAVPTGTMADYARGIVAAAAANAKTLIDWLAANGAQVNEGALQRAAELTKEARAAAAPEYHPHHYFPALRLIA